MCLRSPAILDVMTVLWTMSLGLLRLLLGAAGLVGADCLLESMERFENLFFSLRSVLDLAWFWGSVSARTEGPSHREASCFC